jgi:protein-S-isoprenylcysteine O-methyltransferase Ste14
MPRAVFVAALFLLLLAVGLFGSAGRLDWPMAWAFLAVMGSFVVTAFVLIDPALIRERASLEAGIEPKDVILAGLGFVGLYPGTVVVAGLDAVRFAWSPPLPAGAKLLALAVFALGYGFAFWAMRANPFFSTFVRIQEERGHRVVSEGPYAYVRHPGYAGTLLAHVALPLALGSLWGLIPALIGVVAFVARTGEEDATLERGLPGYREYQQRVRWRLVPGLW